jgi:hypothetical protein
MRSTQLTAAPSFGRSLTTTYGIGPAVGVGVGGEGEGVGVGGNRTRLASSFTSPSSLLSPTDAARSFKRADAERTAALHTRSVVIREKIIARGCDKGKCEGEGE